MAHAVGMSLGEQNDAVGDARLRALARQQGSDWVDDAPPAAEAVRRAARCLLS